MPPALAIFVKEPAPGTVKTRLAATIGARQAAAVYRQLVAATLACATAARRATIIGAIELWCAPSAASRYFRGVAARTGAALCDQAGGDLGARMQHAIAAVLTRADAVLLVGTDCPALTVDHLALASARLATHEVVLSPAEDGGFVLVGARRSFAFGPVRWSTAHAYADTAAALTAGGIRWTDLPVLWDVDDAADLARWQGLHASPPATVE